jgi:YesN/AraC family two-component response regulator
MLMSQPIDLLLTDYAMPRMSGGELVEKVAAVQPDLKVIVLSGYADLPQGKSLSVYRLSKPFSDAELARAIADVVG